MFGRPGLSDGGDIIILICLVISYEHMIKGSGDSIIGVAHGKSPIFVAMDIVVIEIFLLIEAQDFKNLFA